MTKPYFRQVPNFSYVNRNLDAKISDYTDVKNLFKRGKLREDIFGNLSFFTKYKIVGDERPDNVAYKIYEDSTLDWVVLLSNNILNVQSEWPLSQTSFDKIMLERYGSYENLYSGIHHYQTTKITDSNGITLIPEGLRMPNQWKTNGNFTEVINSKISQIFSGNGQTPSTTVTVTMNNGIQGLQVGSEVTINNISETVYNGRYKVTSVYIPFDDGSARSFTYELSSAPSVASPTMSTSQQEEALFTIENGLYTGNSYYYEYYDSGLGSLVQIPSTSFLVPVTNYEYESQIEDGKRNIYVLKPRYLNVVFNDLEDLMEYKKGGTQYVSSTLKKGDNIRLFE
jgi:hypothetical protein